MLMTPMSVVDCGFCFIGDCLFGCFWCYYSYSGLLYFFLGGIFGFVCRIFFMSVLSLSRLHCLLFLLDLPSLVVA